MEQAEKVPTATTNVSNDGEVAISTMKMKRELDMGLLSNASTGFSQEIETFLAKPYPILTGNFSATDTSGSFLTYDALRFFFSKPIYASKVAGFMAIRATLVLRLQVNADRFMQGKYFIVFAPLMNTTLNFFSYGGSQPRLKQVRSTKMTVTQLPRVELDLACDTEAILEIPYVSTYTHYNLLNTSGDLGSWFLYPYSPLQTGSGGSTTCEFTVWASLKDVKLVAPSLLTQSGVANPKFFKSDKIVQSVLQMGPMGKTIKRGAAPTEVEQNMMNMGPVESVLKKVSKAADIIAQIPILSAVAGPVSWASDIFAKAANVFGWSKPLILSPVERMVQAIFPWKNNCDGADSSMPLAAMSSNCIEVLPGFAGTDVDESALDVFKTIPAYFAQFDMSVNDNVGTLLYYNRLSPSVFFNTQFDGTQQFYTRTPVCYLSQMFNQYRGSIRITFKIAKTEFHSGRILVAFSPGNLSPTITLEDTTYLHREIIDLRMGNEFSFVFPYVSTTTYRNTNEDGAYGSFYLLVLNSLVAPASVSSSITVLAEVSAAPDMEFAVPVPCNLVPYVNANIQCGDWRLQMGMGDDTTERNECSIVDTMVGNSSIMNDQLSSARYCVGEKIMSLNQLVKRTHGFQESSRYVKNSGIIWPWSIPVDVFDGNEFYGATYLVDWYTIVASCFALSRGGMRINVIPGANTQAELISVQLNTANRSFRVPNYIDDVTSPSMYTSYDNASAVLGVTQSLHHRGGSEVTVPQYMKTHSRLNQEMYVNPNFNLGYNASGPTAPASFVTWQYDGTGSTYGTRLTRACADDVSFGYFTGVPPSILPNHE